MSTFDAQLIVEGIYLGSEDAGLSLKELTERRITHVLVPANTGREAVVHPDSLIYLQVYVADMKQFPLLPCCLEFFFPFIDQVLDQGKVLLIHCAAGKSRSAGVVIAYLMWKRGISFDEALAIVRSARPQVSTKFEDQLRQWNVGAKKNPFAKVMFDNRRQEN